MAAMEQFRWHPDARLYAGGVEVPRPIAPAPTTRHIAPGPVSDMLAQLANALAGQFSFAVTNTAPATLPPRSFVTQTGGSTGSPKMIRRTPGSWCASFEVNAERFALTASDRAAVLGHLTHSLALYGVLEALHVGADAEVLADVSFAVFPRDQDAVKKRA